MSFTTEVINELLSLPMGKTCCRKALLCGILYGSVKDRDRYGTDFISEEGAKQAAELLNTLFSAGCELEEKMAGSHKIYRLSFASKALGNILSALDSDRDEGIEKIVGFRCEGCLSNFLRGVFISSMSITDPTKAYHMELRIASEKRAERLSGMLEENIGRAGVIRRERYIGLYYKSNSKISDALCFVGGSRSGFFTANVSIENDIRNNENRATNCVASNISRSVEASQKHLNAIKQLRQSHKFENLPPELRYTAELREENFDASLSELAHLHEPPISKSGLNRRLRLLLEAAED